MKEQKFRPSLTERELLYLMDLLSTENRESKMGLHDSLHSKLKVFVLKAQLGIITPAYESSQKSSTTEKLTGESMAERRERAHELYLKNPSLLSRDELELAHTYRYENDLMSHGEEELYESGKLLEIMR